MMTAGAAACFEALQRASVYDLREVGMDCIDQMAPGRRVSRAVIFVVARLAVASPAFAPRKGRRRHHNHAFVREFLWRVTLLLRRGLAE
jgi:hypothetical protein